MKHNVLILYNKIWSYRVEVFNLLNKKYDLTVAYTDKNFLDKSFNFRTIYTPGFKFGPFFFHYNNLHKIAKKYDVIIGLYDVRMLSIMSLSVFKRKFKVLYWGIGVTASYENKFDSKQTWDKVRFFFGKRADALIFYSDYPLNRYLQHGFNREKLYVANNTVSVSDIGQIIPELKHDFLFIGTLYRQKGIDILIDSYIELFKYRDLVPKLHIIGGGPQESEIRQIVIDKKMSDQIELHGAIYDMDILKKYFQKSIVCISPSQAGLSVLTSMGYGVPYLTSADAITGGEIFNIEDKVTGLIYSGGTEELTKTLLWVVDNKERMLEIGKNARDFYNLKRRPEHMANSIIESIKYVLNETLISKSE